MQPLPISSVNEYNKSSIMQHLKIVFLFLIIPLFSHINAQDSNEYIEFNDRKNIVHGFYLGLHSAYGEIKGKSTYIGGLKIAYVANQKFEVGFVTKGLFSNQNLSGIFSSYDADLTAIYSGIHLEPIFFSKAKINLSFPVLIGGGVTGYINTNWSDEELERSENEDWDAVFVVEPGINILYNISRYIQLETGIKYRFSNEVELYSGTRTRINGFSAGFGVKLGVFNLGRNRYKKKIQNHE
ncbi:hypothetical protein [Aquimarina longa]|uniref:hypothetical protein n=1 Tax=Aquimarina longa TaxID=1080221 RepID=UPI000AE296EA|nr:hypothetical protein [Aquimarina longa]